MTSHLRRYLIAGLLLWIPIWVTLLVIGFLVNLMDKSLALIPKAYKPETLLGVHIPGLGLVITVIIVLVTGMIVTNFLGRRLVNVWERFLAKIPLVRTIYKSVKQVVETIFSSKGQAFRQVILLQYPRAGLWSIAFKTGEGTPAIENEVGEKVISLFVPTTPNPTSGFLILVPEKDTRVLDMSVDDALKMVISLGVMQPKPKVIPDPEPKPESSN